MRIPLALKHCPPRSRRPHRGRGPEPIWGFARDAGAELLHSPASGRTLRDVPVHKPTRANIEHDKHVEESEGRGHGHEEIAREHVSGVIANEGAPDLRPRPLRKGDRCIYGLTIRDDREMPNFSNSSAAMRSRRRSESRLPS